MFVVDDWFVSSGMPVLSSTCAEDDAFDSCRFCEDIFCPDNTDDRDLCNTVAPPARPLLSSCRLAALLLEYDLPDPSPVDFVLDVRLRSSWVSDFARRAYSDDQSGDKPGVSGNVWYPADPLDGSCDEALDSGRRVTS